MSDFKLENLLEINRNSNGDYYFIFSVPQVVNHIRPGSKKRDEVLIVGVPKKQLIKFLSGQGVVDDFNFYICDKKEV